MVFDSLPETLQEVYRQNFVIFYKLTIILIFLTLSILIIKNFKPKDSKYVMVKYVRLTYYVGSWIILFTLPFQFGYLSPGVPLGLVLRWVFFFYMLNFVVLGIIVALNVVVHGSGLISDLFMDTNLSAGVKSDFKKHFGNNKDTKT